MHQGVGCAGPEPNHGIEPELVRSATPIELFPGFVIPVATVAHLLPLKVLSVADERPQDLVDIRSLLVVADDADVEQARASVLLSKQQATAATSSRTTGAPRG